MCSAVEGRFKVSKQKNVKQSFTSSSRPSEPDMITIGLRAVPLARILNTSSPPCRISIQSVGESETSWVISTVEATPATPQQNQIDEPRSVKVHPIEAEELEIIIDDQRKKESLPPTVQVMAVASGRAGRVLTRPLFRRLNVHMRTLNTCAVALIRPAQLSIVCSTTSDGKLGGSLGATSASSQCESESLLPMAMITAKKRSPSKFLAAGTCLPYVATTCALSYAQSAIITSQFVRVVTIEILFAKNCRTYKIWALIWPQKRSSSV